jgi:hypothetical protein
MLNVRHKQLESPIVAAAGRSRRLVSVYNKLVARSADMLGRKTRPPLFKPAAFRFLHAGTAKPHSGPPLMQAADSGPVTWPWTLGMKHCNGYDGYGFQVPSFGSCCGASRLSCHLWHESFPCMFISHRELLPEPRPGGRALHRKIFHAQWSKANLPSAWRFAHMEVEWLRSCSPSHLTHKCHAEWRNPARC